MVAFRFKQVCLEAFAIETPTDELTSAAIEDRLAPVYERLGIPFGTLERLSGIKSRYFWPQETGPSEVATKAAERALEKIGFDRKHIGAVFNCSVCRDFFEPATACMVHQNLKLPESTIAMDITNACVGFSNGISMLGSMIESGIVKAGVLVSGENVARIVLSSMEHVLRDTSINREDMLKLLPTFTLGCGAVAFVMCHESIATTSHRVKGAVAYSATEFNDLCTGNGDYYIHQRADINPIMATESAVLISTASKLGGRTWKEASEVLGWSRDDVDHCFCHQVGKQVGEWFYKEMGLPFEKEYTIYRKYGNLVSAALPTAFVLGTEERAAKEGDKIVLTGFGSGLNSVFTGIEW